MSGGYNAKVVRPDLYKIQTESGSKQKPFHFGGSQVPVALFLSKKSLSGSGFTMSNTNPTIEKKRLVLPFHR